MLNIGTESVGSIGTPSAGYINVYGDSTSFRLSSKDQNGQVSTMVDLETTQVIAGSKTMTNLITSAGTTAVPSTTITHGTNLSTQTIDSVENDGNCLYFTTNTTDGRFMLDGDRYFKMSAEGGSITAISDVFGANSAIPLVANGIYEIEWHCWIQQYTGAATTWTFTIVTATTALAAINAAYHLNAISGLGTVAASVMAGAVGSGGGLSSLALPVTGSMAAGVHYARVFCQVVAGNGASNIRLRLTVAANSAKTQAAAWFRVRRIAGNTGAFVA